MKLSRPFLGRFALLVLLALYLPGCGNRTGNNISAVITDSNGLPASEANVVIVQSVSGSPLTLEDTVTRNLPLYGWKYQTDAEGHLNFKALPKARASFDSRELDYILQQRLMTPEELDRFVAQNSVATAYEPGQELGVVIYSRGAKPWVGHVTFDPPNRHFKRFRLRPANGSTARMSENNRVVSIALTPDPNYTSGSATDYATRTTPITPSGDVYVHGYYRKNGTYVRPHTRSRPRK